MKKQVHLHSAVVKMIMIFAAPTTKLLTVKILPIIFAVKMAILNVTESAMMIAFHAVPQEK